VRRIHISNVYGSFYQYCIGLTKFYDSHGAQGQYDQICLSNIYAEKYPRQDFHHKQRQTFEYAPIWLESRIHVKNLQISNLHRRESQVPIALVHINPDTQVDVLSMEHVSQENASGTPIPVLWNQGCISRLYMRDVETDEDPVRNDGTITRLQYS